MRILLTLILVLSFLSVFSQSEWKPPVRKDCFVSKDKKYVKSDTLLLFRYQPLGSYPLFDTLIYNEVDSNRLIGWGREIEPILPLLTTGLLDAKLLMDIGSPSETYSDFFIDRCGIVLNTNKTIDWWPKECVFLGLEGDVKQMQQPHVRVFKLDVTSRSRSSTSIFYLEATNLSGAVNMTSAEFLSKAYISCIAKWYVEY